MTFLRVVLSIFAILNVVFWALLAWVWAVKPSWAARIPLNLGTDQRFKTALAVWARLASAVAAFWAVAAGLYLAAHAPHRLAVHAPFVLDSLWHSHEIGQAARVDTGASQPRPSLMGHER